MDNNKSRHHIIPRSRRGVHNKANIAKVRKTPHDRYHALFANKKPDEIIEFLVTEFWNGQWYWVQRALD